MDKRQAGLFRILSPALLTSSMMYLPILDLTLFPSRSFSQVNIQQFLSGTIFPIYFINRHCAHTRNEIRNKQIIRDIMKCTVRWGKTIVIKAHLIILRTRSSNVMCLEQGKVHLSNANEATSTKRCWHNLDSEWWLVGYKWLRDWLHVSRWENRKVGYPDFCLGIFTAEKAT